jgi:DNA-binding NarL/FixJ family response regulator
VSGAVADGPSLESAVAATRPDVAIVDIRMPPSYTHEGAEAATRLRAAWPRLGILLLSQSIESRFALELARTHPTGFGYLLNRKATQSRLAELTERERDVLAQMAEGRSIGRLRGCWA